MKQTPKKIDFFKRGDKITRIKPSKPMMKIADEDVVNRNYIGSPFIFVGIANGCIYLNRIQTESEKELSSLLSMLGGLPKEVMINIELELFEDGWDYYIDPKTLEPETIHDNLFELKRLEKEKNIALDKEDYKEVEKLTKEIKKLKKHKDE